jgi:hypothetical protein
MKTSVTVFLLFLCAGVVPAAAQIILDVETGLVMNGSNDVRIPNGTGTTFSLTDDLETDPDYVVRGRITYPITGRHILSVLLAPLRVEAYGRTDREIMFNGRRFAAHADLHSVYRFDSYRLTYRYRFHDASRLRAGIGFTLKLRDAAISLAGDGKSTEKVNSGFVPLVNFNARLLFTRRLGMVVDADALAAPQGRAEDVLVALQYSPHRDLALNFGYRILEGGVDVDEVYNFALFHYLVVGASFTFHGA